MDYDTLMQLWKEVPAYKCKENIWPEFYSKRAKLINETRGKNSIEDTKKFIYGCMDRYNIYNINGEKKFEAMFPIITNKEMDSFTNLYPMYTDIQALWEKYVIHVISISSFEPFEKTQYYIDTYEELAVKTALNRLEDNKITDRRQIHIYLSLFKFIIEVRKNEKQKWYGEHKKYKEDIPPDQPQLIFTGK